MRGDPKLLKSKGFEVSHRDLIAVVGAPAPPAAGEVDEEVDVLIVFVEVHIQQFRLKEYEEGILANFPAPVLFVFDASVTPLPQAFGKLDHRGLHVMARHGVRPPGTFLEILKLDFTQLLRIG